MTRKYFAPMAVASILCVSAVANADDAAVRKELNTVYKRLTNGFLKKDMNSLMSTLTPDAVFKEANGRVMTRDQMKTLTIQNWNMFQFSKIDLKIQKLAVSGKNATANVWMKYDGTLKDQKGKAHPVGFISTSVDKWTKSGKGWLIKEVDTVSESMTMDGKPFSMGGPPSKK